MRRLIIILSLAVGCLLIGIGQYIDNKVNSGKEQLAGAQDKLDKLGKVSSLVPGLKQIDEGINKQAAPKIAMAQDQISYYQSLAQNLKLISLVFFAIAAIFIARHFLAKRS